MVATFLPSELRVTADLTTDRLRRGLFEAPVYRSTVEISGSFDPPDFEKWAVPADRVIWERAEVVFDVSDVRSVQAGARLRWGEAELAFQPGTGLRGGGRTGIHARLGDAEWRISHLGRGYPQNWRDGTYGEEVDAATVGVDLLTPIDPYRQSVRSLKYSLLFLALTFGVAWLFEVLGGARLHLIHYALIGAAMCLFYLLELALSEHIGFPAAYAIAAALVVITNGAYARSLLSTRRAALLAGGLCVLYGAMYMLLQLDDYALLAGAVGLFLILAAIMYATRAVDWHAVGSTPAKAGGGTS